MGLFCFTCALTDADFDASAAAVAQDDACPWGSPLPAPANFVGAMRPFGRQCYGGIRGGTRMTSLSAGPGRGTWQPAA